MREISTMNNTCLEGASFAHKLHLIGQMECYAACEHSCILFSVTLEMLWQAKE